MKTPSKSLPLATALMLSSLDKISAFVPFISPKHMSKTSQSSLNAALQSGQGKVGVIGAGFQAVLTAKVASIVGGYDTWIVCPPGEEAKFDELIYASDSEKGKDGSAPIQYVQSEDIENLLKAGDTEALFMIVDGEGTLRPDSIGKIFDWGGDKLKRVVAMSRNLANNEGYGFFAKAAKTGANNEIWLGPESPPELIRQYKEFEDTVKKSCEKNGIEYTIARAGTLKGGGIGAYEEDSEVDDEESGNCYPQYLTKRYYELTKKDLITWQLLYDCDVRGVTISSGDVAPGPGFKAILNAKNNKANAGDTSRCGLAETMVRSLSVESAGNADFGVGVADSRTIPTDEEWTSLFGALS
eukprot:CAMPEP_0194271598 /NCGR_PEP_ID=MMETSP0169-20130528/5342_1 /TAXON_ID=218684 /ORGANISM="Corethron pennatum, Strain L29A3" /LENGTH=354 /DNA_ID=CAMNT_0039013981 /DNA_START=56 /DNA_END=1120 /DNA_ORIENTATION=-